MGNNSLSFVRIFGSLAILGMLGGGCIGLVSFLEILNFFGILIESVILISPEFRSMRLSSWPSGFELGILNFLCFFGFVSSFL
jgi:hypothetical protein